MIGDFGSVALIGIAAALILWFASKRGFFVWPPRRDWNRDIRLVHLLSGFILYFAISFLGAPIYLKLLRKTDLSPIGYISWFNFLLSFSLFIGLLLLWRSFPRAIRSNIWRMGEQKFFCGEDLKWSFYGWLVACPLVLFVNQLSETLLFLITGIKQIPDQLAVRFVKMTAAYPLYFSLAIIAVVVLAPLIEEFLFRGLLQSFIRKQLGSKQAILITALCFSLFHFSPDQGLANISILASLFPLALFLGFLYEKQRSLLASIGLHFLFNAMSILNLYLMGEIF